MNLKSKIEKKLYTIITNSNTVIYLYKYNLLISHSKTMNQVYNYRDCTIYKPYSITIFEYNYFLCLSK